MDKHALIFAGAGASKAVNRDRFPTTVEFFERLPDNIKNDELFRLTVEYLSRSDSQKIIDIEEVLWELQNLREFCSSYERSDCFVGFGLGRSRLTNTYFGPGQNTGMLDQTIAHAGSACNALIENINASVYDFYSHEPSQSELKDNWLLLLSYLRKYGYLYNIFTTNYDLAIETAISIDRTNDYDRFVGSRGRINKILDVDRWQNPKPYEQLLTKLHGSINWKLRGADVTVGDGIYTGDHKKQVIIYPGFKGQIVEEPFSTLHNYLGATLETMELAIFIGFAFRDEYIDRLLAERLNRDCKIFIINPEKKVKFPVNRRHVSHLRLGFGSESLKEVFSGMTL
jgi:hypothetical protein